jgi:hypothetical protein
VASISLALTRRPPRSVGLYLLAQLAFCPAVWIGNWLWGVWSPWYGGVYVAATLPILWCIARLCWESLERRKYRARIVAISFLIAAALGKLSYIGLARPVTWFDWLNLTLGVFLASAGTLLGFTAPYVKRGDIALILGMYWVWQAVSSWGWTLYLWEDLNWVIDPALSIAAFTLLAWRLHREQVLQVRERHTA